jgi:hypothetical protein
MPHPHSLKLTVPYSQWTTCKLFLTHNYMTMNNEYVVDETNILQRVTITFKCGSNYLMFKHAWAHILITAED